MQNKIFALMVIYNKRCDDSVAYNALKKIDDLKVIVCDNSTDDYNNSEIVNTDENIYINMNGNKGLSKAYNAALEKLDGETGILCLFDDDTDIPQEYFDELNAVSQDESWDICLPKVFGKAGMMSPCILKKYHIRKITELENADMNYIVGINSGMAVRLSLLKDFRYDENLFLDFVDFNFMLEMRKRNAKIKVMDTKLVQDFSAENNSLSASKARYKIKKKDLEYFYRKGLSANMYLMFIKFKHKLKMALKFKKPECLLW